jgi:dihydropteroate synthase
MHTRGTPQTMTHLTKYDNLIKDLLDYFHSKIFQLQLLGVKDIIIDPGFGFAKTVDQNFEILNKLDQFQILGKPILAGISRKSMIWKPLKVNPDKALNGTTALNAIALLKGVSILRVHDVREANETTTLIHRINKS